MWENQQRGPAWGASGVSSEKELLDPLTAFWITNHFRHPSYLKSGSGRTIQPPKLARGSEPRGELKASGVRLQ
jgi:hypothetical protein